MLKKTVVQKAFMEIIAERVHKVAWNKAKQDDRYVEAEKQKQTAFQLLNESLTDKQQRLLDDLEFAWNYVDNINEEFAYRQGLQDSQMIHKELSEFGISVAKESVKHD